MPAVAAGGLVDWEALTGQSRFVIDLVSVPIFSAIAGVITNWTGVIMLFAPVRFRGFRCPGVKTIFHFLPRKLQVLPIWAPGGILGFQGFIPARAERMASICVDKGLVKIGSIRNFFEELEPDVIATHLGTALKPHIPELVEDVMRREHPELWRDLPTPMRQVITNRVEERTPEIATRAMDAVGEHIDDLLDVRLMVVGRIRERPELMKNIIYDLGAPELRFMVRVGFWMGLPLGLVLALVLHFHGSIPLLGWLPSWAIVLGGASIIGVIVNIIAIKCVFEPGAPQPRWRYLWKQAKFAKRQHEAAGAFGHSIAYDIITMPNIGRELMHGPRCDRTRVILGQVIGREVDGIIGPSRALVKAAIGPREYERIRAGTSEAVNDRVADLLSDVDFTEKQAVKIDKFATARLRELPPEEFMEMLYSAIEQDAWLLYAHGGVLGFVVGLAHLVLFGG